MLVNKDDKLLTPFRKSERNLDITQTIYVNYYGEEKTQRIAMKKPKNFQRLLKSFISALLVLPLKLFRFS